MTIRLTPARLAAAYECLRAFPPFCRWRLPPASDVRFTVLKTKAAYGQHRRLKYSDKHFVYVSAGTVGHLNTLMCTMAHELIHVAQDVRKTTTPNTEHNAQFWRIAKSVARQFGWDERSF